MARDSSRYGDPRPMNRLVQGDVGCGKTVVALHALVMACGSGCQTGADGSHRNLKEQHYLNLRPPRGGWFQGRAAHERGRVKDRQAVFTQLASGEAQVAIGTHALIQKNVAFDKLGLVVVDEQHKFGVLQRKSLLGQRISTGCAGNDGHADSSHLGDDCLWRSGRFSHRYVATWSQAGADHALLEGQRHKLGSW